MTKVDLPSFAKPPVVETIIGVQFEPIAGFTNCHLGAFWTRLGGRASWPYASDAMPLRQEFERFGEDQRWQQADTVFLGITQVPASRMQLRNGPPQDRMLQVQNGRLIYNWLGNVGGEYARYQKIRPEFDHYLEEFRRFLLDEQLPAMQANQWEVTYVNQFPKGTVWQDVGDWQNVFKFRAVPPAVVNACRLETFGGQWVYEIVPRRGRLRMQLQHAKDQDGRELLAFNLSARGPVREGDEAVDTLEAGVDLGHEVIVSSFAELTSPEARRYWEEQTNADT